MMCLGWIYSTAMGQGKATGILSKQNWCSPNVDLGMLASSLAVSEVLSSPEGICMELCKVEGLWGLESHRDYDHSDRLNSLTKMPQMWKGNAVAMNVSLQFLLDQSDLQSGGWLKPLQPAGLRGAPERGQGLSLSTGAGRVILSFFPGRLAQFSLQQPGKKGIKTNIIRKISQ